MNGEWKLPAATSAKRDAAVAAGSAPSTARTSHTAMVLRSIASSGQNPAVHSVPSNTPSAASALTASV